MLAGVLIGGRRIAIRLTTDRKMRVIRSIGPRNGGNRQCLRISAWLSRATKTGQYETLFIGQPSSLIRTTGTGSGAARMAGGGHIGTRASIGGYRAVLC